MKTITRKTIWSVCVLGTALLLTNCERQKDEPLDLYTFTDLRNLTMPATTLRAAAAVTVTPATLTPSALATAASNGYATAATTGQVPAAVTQAASSMGAALSGAGWPAPAFVSNFTPDVINTLVAQGAIPGSLQTTVSTLAANPSVQGYLPTVTYPTVNGQPVTPTTTTLPVPTPPAITVPVTLKAVNYAGSDACFKAANDLFDATTAGFETNRLGQVAAVNTTYGQAKSGADNGVADCATNTLATYKAAVAGAKGQLDANVANLNAARSVLGEQNYFNLLALSYVQFTRVVGLYITLQTTELNTCTLVRDAKIAEARVARDTNISAINVTFNGTVASAQAIVLRLLDSCHNQGAGG